MKRRLIALLATLLVLVSVVATGFAVPVNCRTAPSPPIDCRGHATCSISLPYGYNATVADGSRLVFTGHQNYWNNVVGDTCPFTSYEVR